MKKYINFLFIILILSIILCGCNRADDTDIDTENGIENSVEKFSGNISKSWDEVEDEYDNIKLEARREVSEMDTITNDDIKELSNTIKDNYASLKNGINDQNENKAKESYKASIKLQEIAKKDGKRVNHELTTFAENSEALIKHYYGKGENDFTKVKNDFEKQLDNIKDYTEEKFKEFINLLQ